MMRKRQKSQSKVKYVADLSLEGVLELQRRMDYDNYSPQNWRYIRNGGIEDEEGFLTLLIFFYHFFLHSVVKATSAS